MLQDDVAERAATASAGAAREEEQGHAPATPSPGRLEAVVAVGASAGGLAALKRLLAATPGDADLAIVIIVHLSPHHESHLVDLLQPHAHMPVTQIVDTVMLERNRIYVIPPNVNVSSVDSHLRLSELESDRRERAPIDHFFRTLSQTHDGHSVGVVLTGTGSDGTLGLKRIKERGGLTIVQDPNEAEYDGMPQAAIASGFVDQVLGVEEIPAAIVRFARAAPLVLEEVTVANTQERLLLQLLALIRSRTGRDFSRYKRSTLLRRLSRRMQLREQDRLEAYLAYVRANPLECEALADEFLVTVTEFFRDRDVFAEVEAEVVPKLFEGKGGMDGIRVWSVGCATGEEAYSLTILLMEHAATLEVPPMIQVFASDLHDPSLRRAREGVYPETIEALVDEKRLRRYFVKENGTYRVRKEVREKIVFTPHNVLEDAPFSRIDLLVCRNMLIYLERGVQSDVIDLFHYALNPGGFLLLGPSEGIERDDTFTTEHKSISLFRKRGSTGASARRSVPALRMATRTFSSPADPPATRRVVDFGDVHDELIDRVGLPSMLMSGDNTILHLSQRAGDYLYHPGGEPTGDTLRLLRVELRLEFRGAVHAARTTGASVRSAPVMIEREGKRRSVVLDVRPAVDPRHAGMLLVLFDEHAWAHRDGASAKAPADESESDDVTDLERELELTRDRLRSVVEDTESSNEELRASNEELQSMNEELRSAMEELETSKEELQSVNEELVTVNEENRHKVVELAQMGSDLHTLMSATEIATLFLDRKLRILRFTPRVATLFSIRDSDRGRPLADLTHHFGDDDDLVDDAASVLDRLVPIERELMTDADEWFLTRIHPYRSAEDRIEGVVITFVDITQRKAAERRVHEVNTRLEDLVAQRTNELRHAIDELEAFNYSVSHDLRAPLRSIQRFGRAVLTAHGERLDDDGRDLLQQSLDAAERMGDLIDGLLELSSVGRIELRHETIDVSAMVEDVVLELQGREPDRVVDVAIDSDIVAHGDRRLLRIALSNLLSNAWKFTRDEHEARIEVRDRSVPGEHGVEVHDNGVGFDMRLARRLFTPFQRLHPAETFEGSGVGLALVHRIAVRHGGIVDVAGRVGGGATFTLRLPERADEP